MSRKSKFLVSALAALFIQLSFQSGAFAAKNMVKHHRERWEYENREWTAPEVILNVNIRVPVVDTVGYLAVFYNEPQRFNQLVAKMRPIMTRVNELSDGTFKGHSFPAETEAELDKLRGQMFADVQSLYGDEALSRLKEYLGSKYGSIDSSGLF